MEVWTWGSGHGGLYSSRPPLQSCSCWEVLGLAVVVWAPQAVSGRGTRVVRSACGVPAGAGASCSSCIFAAAFHVFFFFFPMLGCNGVVGPGGIGTNFCTCCSENAGNGSRDRNGLTFTSSPCVRDLTLPNLLCRLYFSWFLGRLDTYLFFDACTIRLLVLS